MGEVVVLDFVDPVRVVVDLFLVAVAVAIEAEFSAQVGESENGEKSDETDALDEVYNAFDHFWVHNY